MKSTKLLFAVLIFSPVFVFADGNLTVITGDLSTLSTTTVAQPSITGDLSTGVSQTGNISTGTIAGTGVLQTIKQDKKNQSKAIWDEISAKSQNMKANIKTNIAQINKNWSDFFAKYAQSDKSSKWIMKKSIDKKALETLRKQKKSSEKAAFDSLNALYKIGTGDAVSKFYKPRIAGLTAYYSGYAAFIDPSSIDKYNAYVSDIMNVYKTNSDLRVQNFVIWSQFKEYRQSQIANLSALSSTLINKLNSIFSTWSTSKIQNLINVVDTKIAKIQEGSLSDEAKSKQIDFWSSVKAIAQSRLEGSQLLSSAEDIVE